MCVFFIIFFNVSFSKTTIEKLKIQGIRSFSPKSPQVIEFEKPLTIIVGHNGAGKTTIIEALNYATTGEKPPGTGAGAAFVHDPKHAGQREVKGEKGKKVRQKRFFLVLKKDDTHSFSEAALLYSQQQQGGGDAQFAA